MTSVTSTCSACGATYRGRVQQCPNCKRSITPDLPELAPGDVVDGKYEIVSLLGAGGMGQVFKARHIHLNTFRTVKVMRKNLLLDESNRNRFVREARLATLVHHQNVAVVHDFATLPDGTHYMVSEFIDGVTVRQWMRQYGRLGVPLSLRIALQVLSGLESIHRAGLLHRDLSADNIMISAMEDGEAVAKIIDLGIAKQLAGTATLSEATQVGLFVGNPRYSSPEQLGSLPDTEEIDGRADLYCFGIVLYEMIAGSPPFVATTPQGYAIKHLTETPPALVGQPGPGDVTPALQAVIFRALEKKREKRYASAREFGLALAPFATDVLSAAEESKIRGLRARGSAAPTLTSPYEAPPPAADASPTITPPPALEDREDQAWRAAARAATREAFQRFLDQFPAGIYATAARARMAELDLMHEVRRMSERGDVSGLQKLAQAHTAETPMGQAVRDALQAAIQRRDGEAEAEWQEANRRGGREPFQRFLRNHPDSPHAQAARLMLADLELLDEVEALERRGDASAIRTIADANLTNARITEAALSAFNRLADARRRQTEAEYDDAWRMATRDGRRDAFRTFLQAHPDGPRSGEARDRIEELELLDEVESLERRGDIAGLRRMLEADPSRPRIAPVLRTAIDRLEEEGRRRRLGELEEAWKSATREGTRDAYEAFLRQHPQGIHALEARAHLDEIDLHADIDRMAGRADVAGLRALASTQKPDSPAGLKIAEALDRLENTMRRRRLAEQEGAWRDAERDGSRESLQRFLHAHPDSPWAAEARTRVREMDLTADVERLERAGDLTELKRLAETQPAGSRAGLAAREAFDRLTEQERRRRAAEEEAARQRRLAAEEAERQQRIAEEETERRRRAAEAEAVRLRRLAEEEEHDWSVASQSGTALGWKVYLTKHAEGTRAGLARRLFEEAQAFEQAAAANTASAWSEFLEAWPESRFRPTAQQRLQESQQVLAYYDYAIAVKAGTPEAYQRFLTDHPDSPHTAEARQRWSLLTDLARARTADRASVWREVIERHPDEPQLAEGRARLVEIEDALTREFDAALASRSAAGLRTALQRDPSPFTADLARRGLEEVTALQNAVRAGTVEALRRFSRNYATGHFENTITYLLGKVEEASFLALVSSRSRARAIKFLTDFPESSKTVNVRRLLASIDETDAFNLAVREIRRGNLKPADEALAKLADPHLRTTLTTAVNNYRNSGSGAKLRMMADYFVATAMGSLRGTGEQQPEVSPASAELRKIKDSLLEELRDVAGVLKAEAQRFETAPAPPEEPPARRTAVPKPSRGPATADIQKRLAALEAASAPRRSRLLPIVAAIPLLIVAAGTILWFADRERALAIVERGRSFYRRATGAPEPWGQLRVDAMPWGRVESISDGTRNWITDVTYTPAVFSVPPGRYEVVIAGPDGRLRRTESVQVAAGAAAPPLRPSFDMPDPAEVLQQLQ